LSFSNLPHHAISLAKYFFTTESISLRGQDAQEVSVKEISKTIKKNFFGSAFDLQVSNL